jgi:hypothetical protein
MRFNVEFDVLARTEDKDLLEKIYCRKLDRFFYGVYLPRKPNCEVWDIPCVSMTDLYVEATYPVKDDYVVIVLNSFGRRIYPMVDRNSVSGLTIEKIVCRGSMMVFVMETNTGEVSIRKINVIEKNGEAVLLRKRLFHKKVPSFMDRFMPKSAGLPRDSFLSMFWLILVDTCNQANIDNLMLKNNGNPVSAKVINVTEKGRQKVVLKFGVAGGT